MSTFEQPPLDGLSSEMPEPTFETIAIADLPDGPQLPNKDLIESVRTFGVKMAPAVFRREDGSLFVGSGSRTIMAARELGIQEITCAVYGPDAWPFLAIYRLAMNANRSPNPIAELDAIIAMLSSGADEHDISLHTGLDGKTIQRRIKLSSLHETLKVGLQTNKIALAVAEKCSTLDKDVQSQLAALYIAKGKLSMADVNKLIKGDDEEQHEQVSFMAGVKSWRELILEAAHLAKQEGVDVHLLVDTVWEGYADVEVEVS